MLLKKDPPIFVRCSKFINNFIQANTARSDKQSSVMVLRSLFFIIFKEEKDLSQETLVTAIVSDILVSNVI